MTREEENKSMVDELIAEVCYLFGGSGDEADDEGYIQGLRQRILERMQ